MFTAQQDEQILGKKNREISSSNTFQKDGTVLFNISETYFKYFYI